MLWCRVSKCGQVYPTAKAKFTQFAKSPVLSKWREHYSHSQESPGVLAPENSSIIRCMFEANLHLVAHRPAADWPGGELTVIRTWISMYGRDRDSYCHLHLGHCNWPHWSPAAVASGMFVQLLILSYSTSYHELGWGLGSFLRWWSLSTMWDGPLIFSVPPLGMSEWSHLIEFKLCAACWAHFTYHYELWPTSVSHPLSSLNSSLGLAGGKYSWVPLWRGPI